jgi:methionyl-tRNA formyltransferase
VPRIALFSTECAQLGDALTEIIERHHDQLALVVTSDIYAGPRGGFLRQTWRNLRQSGPGFVRYLAYSFAAYPLFLRYDRVRAAVLRRPRVRYSVAELCARHGIRHLRTGRINSAAAVAELEGAGLDLIVVYWFDQILRERVIGAARHGVVNLHAAYLPQCRGLFPTLYSAIEPGARFGVTAHLIENREIDAGPILAQISCPPPPGRSVLFNDSWVNRCGVDLLDEVLADLDALRGRATPQSGGSYHSYPQRSDIAAARRAGLRLSSLRDFRSACRGTGAGTSRARARAPRA